MAKTTKKKTAASAPKSGEIQKSGRMMSPFEEIERYFDRVLPRGWMDPFHWERPRWPELGAAFEGRMPRVDVIDREDEIVIHAELPGVEKDDLDVSMTDNTVTIKGSTRREEKEEKGDYYRCEISRGAFARTVSLPGDVDAEKAAATFKDGILELALPKVKKSRRRSVPIT
jgi:HSP20 family protein